MLLPLEFQSKYDLILKCYYLVWEWGLVWYGADLKPVLRILQGTVCLWVTLFISRHTFIYPKLIQWNLSKPTYQGTREMCRIVQDVSTCLIRHTKGPGKCVRLYRMSVPVYTGTPRDQGNVSDCTGCMYLSNPAHHGTREMCQIVQDGCTCLIRHATGPEKCVRLYRISVPV